MTKFVLKSAYTYWWPVNVSIPGQEAGEWIDAQFQVRFQAITTDEARKRFEEISGGAGLGTLRDDRSNDLLKEAIKDWEGVCDEEGKAIPFSAEALNQVVNNVWALTALWRAWTLSMAGKP